MGETGSEKAILLDTFVKNLQVWILKMIGDINK